MNSFIGFAHIATLSMIILGSVLAVSLKDILPSVIALAISSLLLALEFLFLQAPDVAMAEAGVGAVLSTALFIFVIRATRK